MTQLITIGQIIDQTLHLYQKRFGSFVRIGAWLFLTLPLLVVAEAIALGTGGSLASIIALGAIVVINTIVAIILGYFVTNGLVFSTDAFVQGAVLDGDKLRHKAWSRVGGMFAQGLLLGLMLVGALLLMLPGIGAFVVTSFIENPGVVLPSLGMFLFFAGVAGALILVAWFGVIFPFAPFALLIEDRGIVPGIRRAFALVKGRWWATMVRVLVPKLTFGVIVLFGQLIIIVFVLVISAGLAPMVEIIGTSAVNIITSTLQQIAITAVAVVTTPAFIIADYYVFRNLVETRRGTP